MKEPSYNISAVERDTGLSKDVLRVWERRYGFPLPERDAHGERAYPASQVERLRLVKRLMDQGHRPGKLLGLDTEALAHLAPRRSAAPLDTGERVASAALDGLLDFIRQHDAAGFQQALQQRLAREGLQRLVVETVAPLTRRVGEAWEQGGIQVFEEHLFTELTERLLRQAIGALPSTRQPPRVLLTSVAEEPHALGLLMVEALLSLEGADCIPLGTQLPLQDIARAAAAHRADVVALSFSSAYTPRRIGPVLQQLHELLPGGTAVWAGGGGVRQASLPEATRRIGSLEQGIEELLRWRSQHRGPAAAA